MRTTTRAESAYLQPTAPVLKTVRVPPLLPALSAWTVGTQVLFVEGAAARGWTVDIYDSTTGNWSNHDPGLDDIIQVVVSGQRGVLVGTSAGAARAMVYDAANSQWTSAAIVSPHVGGAAAVLGSRVVLAGGTPDQACTSGDAVDIYDTTDGRWSSAHLSAGRARGMRVVQVADQLLFAGGETCSGVSDRVDIYDGATDRWTSTTLSQARTEITAVAVGTRAILAGGLKPREGWVNGETTDAVDVYDAATGRWTAAHLAEPRVAIAPAVLGTRVLLAGGERPPQFSRRPYEPSALIDVFDASTATWTSDTLSDARAGALVLQLGPRVLFVGGQTDCFACGPRHSLAVDIFALS